MEKHTTKNNGQKSNSNNDSTTASKHGNKGKKKPIKVVYISNPMKVKTSAADFRALVQELTGRDADPSKYADMEDGATDRRLAPQLSPGAASSEAGAIDYVTEVQSDAAAYQSAEGGAFDEFDHDNFMPQLLDNNYSVFSPPSILYDPHKV